MKKNKAIILILAMFLLSITVNGEDWKRKLEENKTVEKMEKIDVNERRVIITGLFIRKVRISRLYFEPATGNTEVFITKTDLEESLKRKNKDIKTIDITINKNGILSVEGIAHLMGMDMKMYLEGTFDLNVSKGELTYTITKAYVNNFVPVPKGILDKFSKKINPFFDLDKLELPLKVKEIIFESDKIYIR